MFSILRCKSCAHTLRISYILRCGSETEMKTSFSYKVLKLRFDFFDHTRLGGLNSADEC